MSDLYIVYALENNISVIKANSKAEAFDIFATRQINDVNLNVFIKEFNIDDGLLGMFYRDDQGHLYDFDQDVPSKYLQQLSEKEQDAYIASWVERNAKQFWSDEPQLAVEYIKEFKIATQSRGFYTGKFSDVFLLSTIKKLIVDNWYEAFDIVKIDLIENNFQVIYEG